MTPNSSPTGSKVAVKKDNPKKVTGMDDSLCGLKVSAAVGKTATLQAEKQAKQCKADGKPDIRYGIMSTTFSRSGLM